MNYFSKLFASSSFWDSVLTMVGRVLLALFVASIFILCDSLSAKWGKHGSLWAFLLMVPLAPVGYWFFGYMNRNLSLSIVTGLVNVFLLIGTVSVGIFYFNDDLFLRHYIGLGFAFASLVLLAW